MRVRPLFLAVPTALVAAAGLAWLTAAAAFDGGSDVAPQIAQAGPPAAPPPAAGGSPAMHGRGGPERMKREFSPRNFCEDRIAHRIGYRAYLKARLDLKPDQMAAWDAFQKAADEASAREKAQCAALPTEMKPGPQSLPDRLTRQEEMMKSRLQTIQAVKPTLVALYDKLTPEQKAVLDRPAMGGLRHPGGSRHRPG